jgi:stringent starvation protein B
MTAQIMTSNRPYLLRAMYEWIADNGMTPYILVDAAAPGVIVPRSAIKDGRVVLNIAARAVAQLELGKDRVRFMARFSGVSQSVEAPMSAILAIYAQENGQGMMFPAETNPPPPVTTADEPAAKKGSHLRVVK